MKNIGNIIQLHVTIPFYECIVSMNKSSRYYKLSHVINIYRPQHFLNFLPLPHEQGSLRPSFLGLPKDEG